MSNKDRFIELLDEIIESYDPEKNPEGVAKGIHLASCFDEKGLSVAANVCYLRMKNGKLEGQPGSDDYHEYIDELCDACKESFGNKHLAYSIVDMSSWYRHRHAKKSEYFPKSYLKEHVHLTEDHDFDYILIDHVEEVKRLAVRFRNS